MAKYISPYTDSDFQHATAELANFTGEQRDNYELSLIQYRDLKSVLETAVEEGVRKIAKRMIAAGSDNAFIAQMADLPTDQIEELRAVVERMKDR